MAAREPLDRDDGEAAVAAPSAFALSRIQAEGWSAGRAVGSAGPAGVARAKRRNPYKTAIERARWCAGFDAALARTQR
jgi:hypothetical protein